MVTKVVVGYGNAARIHKQTFPEAEIIGVVDTNPDKRKEAEILDVPSYTSLNDVFSNGLRPDYFDNTAPTSSHFQMVDKIVSCQPTVNVLTEKPVCLPLETEKMKALSKKSKQANLSVCENYMSSQITQALRNYVDEFGFKKPIISIEFSKDRTSDVKKGRYLDELGAFGYEGPHMLTCVRSIGEGKRMKEIFESVLWPMTLSNGVVKEEQGEALLNYETEDGSLVHFFTSMIGNTIVKLPYSEKMPKFNIKDPDERYRVMLVEEGPITLGGVFEPIPNMPRGEGLVFISQNGNLEEIKKINDNHMRTHQQGVVNFFENKGENPCNVETAISIVEDLDKAVKHARYVI